MQYFSWEKCSTKTFLNSKTLNCNFLRIQLPHDYKCRARQSFLVDEMLPCLQKYLLNAELWFLLHEIDQYREQPSAALKRNSLFISKPRKHSIQTGLLFIFVFRYFIAHSRLLNHITLHQFLEKNLYESTNNDFIHPRALVTEIVPFYTRKSFSFVFIESMLGLVVTPI